MGVWIAKLQDYCGYDLMSTKAKNRCMGFSGIGGEGEKKALLKDGGFKAE